MILAHNLFNYLEGLDTEASKCLMEWIECYWDCSDCLTNREIESMLTEYCIYIGAHLEDMYSLDQFIARVDLVKDIQTKYIKEQ